MTSSFPHVPIDLLEALEARYRDHAPERGATHADVMFDAGQVEVVRFLRSHFRNQQENPSDD